MKIEVLYFAGCPGYEPTLMRLRGILREESLLQPITEIEVKTKEGALALNFRGSPSVRIDGVDIEPAESKLPVGLCCRTYLTEGKLEGIPSHDLIRIALSKVCPTRPNFK